GDTGPCGPCSEVHIDLRPQEEIDKLPGTELVNKDHPLVIEIWNLVFIQFNRKANGNLEDLPDKHVDTGMGFERIVSVIQGVYDNYKTDCFMPIIEAIAKISGVDYSKAEENAPFHVIADHLRMLTFSIGDGGLPSNEGRGYVIRRILRRAARYGRKLNLHEPFIYKLVPVVVEQLGDAFPEIKERLDFIQKVIKGEEESFNNTLDRGLEIFEQLSLKLKKENKKTIPGEEAFKLYDTFGFPVDLTRVLAEEKNMTLDDEGFNKEMEKQRERARQAGKFETATDDEDSWEILSDDNNSIFTGYDELSTETKIVKYLKKENTLNVVLKETPFYAESGGQVGDRGIITSGADKLEVINTIKNGNEIIHICNKNSGFKLANTDVTAVVDRDLRQKTMVNHTSTHLIQAALRDVLGTHVQQSGSFVNPEHLRFDFTHFEKVSGEQIQKIEAIVNEKVRENLAVNSAITSIEKAKKMGPMALFGGKYGEEVRIISIDEYSLELCGGTHISQTGQIGNIIITAESSIASGIRRIEAITGEAAFKLIQQRSTLSHQLSNIFNAPESEVLNRLRQLMDDKKLADKELAGAKQANILADSDKLMQNAELINGVKLIFAEYLDVDVALLK
ncbi:MAG: alanine--tRNA ligase, partial [Calditrichia bacterium]|nr:alanine--tRNA ligase [Calditrichia bacterium]